MTLRDVGFQELAKKQSIDDAVKAAAAKAAPIDEFPSFLKYERNGQYVHCLTGSSKIVGFEKLIN